MLVRTTVLLWGTSIALSGCADLHLYSPQRDDQGKAAQKAWADADPLEPVRTQRENSAALLARELAYVETASLVKRDRELQALAVGPSLQTDLVTKVQASALALVGDAVLQKRLATAEQTQVSFASQYTQAMKEVGRRGFEPFSCADLTSGKADQSIADWLATYKAKQPVPAQVFEGAIMTAKKLCTDSLADGMAVRDLVAAEAASAKAKGTTLPLVWSATDELYAAEQALKSREAAYASDRNAYRAALAQYREILMGAVANAAPTASSAAGASTPQTPDKHSALEQSLTKLKATIDKLKGLSDKYSLKFIAKERITAIDEFLGTMLEPKAAGDPAETDKDRAARTLRLLDETAEQWEAAQANAKEVLTQPLLLQQSLDARQVEALSRSMAADQAEIELLRMRVNLLGQQATHYQRAQGFLRGTEKHHTGSLQSVMFDNKAAAQDLRNERTRLLQASAHYGYASGYLQGQIDGIQLKRLALKNARTLDAAELNVRQWTTLIGSNVDLLSAWAATGVKEDTISKGINALLLLWIGIGVN